MLSKLYTDIREVFFALELALLNKLNVSKKLIYILQSVLFCSESGIVVIALLKLEFMYIFYEVIQITAVASSQAIRLIFTNSFQEEPRTLFSKI